MECPSCHFLNTEGARFCNECGQKLDVICPNCEKPNMPGSKFCNECGQNLVETATSIPKELTFEEKLGKIKKYLPQGLTEKILSQRERIEGERKQVTVMFCDLEGFTPLVETIGADEAYTVMDRFYEILIHCVRDYDGTVNEMKGDGIIALFGAPIALEDAPQRAIHSALDVHRQLAIFNDELKEQKKALPALKVRIGIHSGPVVVGTLGNDLRVEFKAVGDTVNLAARMEDLAEPGSTYITQDTFKLTEGLFRFEALGAKPIKGKDQPVHVYQVITTSSRRTRFDVNAERGLTPLVGRERELGILLEGFETVKSGRGQAFSIVAEAGAGKSRLLYEFRKAVENQNVTILEGKCLSYARNVAWHPVIDILKANFRIEEPEAESDIKWKVTDRLTEMGIDPAATAPFLLDLLSVKESGVDELNLSPELKRDRAVESLLKIVLKGSEQRPLILVYEDLHWVDSTTESLLKDTLAAIPGSRVLLLFSYRPEYVHTWGGKSYHNQVNLNRLSNRESLEMLHYLLGVEETENELDELVLNRTEGIPFFIEEFVKSLIDLGIIEKKEDRYGLVRDIREAAIPSSIQDVIMSRVDRLPDEARGVLQIGSVIEREFSFGLLNEVAEMGERDLISCLSALKDSELIYERGIFPDSVFVFKHAFTREVVYGSLLSARKKELHNRIGQIIESAYAQRLEEFYEILAQHYLTAENQDKAQHYLKLSGEKSMRNYAAKEAVSYFERALNILEKIGESDEIIRTKIDICILIYQSYSSIGYPEEMLQVLQKGEQLARKLSDQKKLSQFLTYISIYYSGVGKPSLGIKHLEESFQTALQSKDLKILPDVAVALAQAYTWLGETGKTLQTMPEVLDLIYDTSDTARYFGFFQVTQYIALCGYCAQSAFQQGRFKQSELFLKKGLRKATKDNDLIGIGLMEFYFGYFYVDKGDGDQSVKYFQNCLNMLEKVENLYLKAISWAYQGRGYYLTGDSAKAIELIEKGFKLLTEAKVIVTQSGNYNCLSEIYLEADDLDKALFYAE